MRGWLVAHARAARDAWRTAQGSPLGSLLSVAALAVALALPLAAFVLQDGLARVAARFDADPQLSVFLAPATTAKDRDALERTLRGRRGIKSVRLVTREQALAELQATEGVRDLLAGLPGNPLPDTLIVKPSDPGRAAVAALKADLERVPGVAAVEVDAAWVERLEAFTRVFGLLTASLAAALALAVIAVTFNTIRLQVLTRARELEVAALLGATSGWLRRPFLYFGTLQGIAAGLLSVLLIRGFVALLNARLDDLIAGFGIGASPVALRWEQALTAVLLSAGLGWLGAWLSVSRHLGRGRPGPG